MEVTKVSKEAIEKAQIALGLIKAEEAAPITDAIKQEEIKKAEERTALEGEYKVALQKAEELKAKMEGKKEEPVAIVKAESLFDFAAFQKANDEKFTALGLMIQAKNEEITELKKVVDESTVKLQKAEEFNEVLGKKVGIIAKQPLERKAVTTTGFIEKGGAAGKENVNEEKSLSLTANKKEISDMLFEKAIGKIDGKEQVVSQPFAKAAQYVELGCLIDDQNLTKQVQGFFKKEHNIVLTK